MKSINGEREKGKVSESDISMKVVFLNSTQHSVYTQFLQSHPLGSIHQSLAWGEMQDLQDGRKNLGVLVVQDDDGKFLASALLIKHQLPFGKCFLYAHRGPVFDIDSERSRHVWTLLLAEIKKNGTEHQAVFLRIDPPLLKSDTNEKFFRDHGFRYAHAQYQPEHTLVLDLTQSLDDLLRQMKEKGRYNIKVAERHSVTIRKSDGLPADMQAFYQLLQPTASRDRFSIHPLPYYQRFLEILGKEQHATLYLAMKNDEVIGGIIVTWFGDTATYYFGASNHEHRAAMAPYLLQWQAIQDAKTAGYTRYDFLGIAPEGSMKHPWQGVTAFKKKFGGQEVHYVGAWEYVYQPFWYRVMLLVKKLKG